MLTKTLCRLTIAILLNCGLALLTTSLLTAQAPSPTEPTIIAGELLIKVDDAALRNRQGWRVGRTLLPIVEQLPRSGWWRVQVEAGQEAEMLAVLRQQTDVTDVNYNYQLRAAVEPDDAAYQAGQLWGLQTMQAITAWQIYTGSDTVTIAVIDSGIDLDHPDLAAKVVTGYNYIDPTQPPTDDYNHGSHVAGIAAAVANNGQGVVGVSWGARLMPLKILDAQGRGSSADLAEAVYFAVDNGAKIINMSLGARGSMWPCTGTMSLVEEAFAYAASRQLLLVGAAGNDYREGVNCPSAFDAVIAVGGTTPADERASFSNYGPRLDVSAPGLSIYSTTFNDSYADKSGTSMATPYVAGLAALIWSFAPQLSALEVRDMLEASAVDLGEIGFDEQFGHGRVDAWRAMQRVNQLQVSLPTQVYVVDDNTPLPRQMQATISHYRLERPLTWTAEISPAVSWLALPAAKSGQVSTALPSHLTLTLNRPQGAYRHETTTLRIDGGPTIGVTEVDLELRYVPQVYQTYLPLMGGN